MQGLRPDPPVENAKMQAEKTDYRPVLVALLHELLNVEQFPTIADLCEALKLRAAQLRIPYDVDRIAEALVIVHRSRPLTARRVVH